MTYEGEGSKYVETVGQDRQHYRRKTGPRGGYIKDAGYVGWSVSTGTTVILIVNTGALLEVYSLPPYGGWSDPSLVGLGEVTSIEYFEPPMEENEP